MTVQHLNHLNREQLKNMLLSCCSSSRWVSLMLSDSPFSSEKDLLHKAASNWDQLNADDISEALKGHPAIGTKSGSNVFSNQEQKCVEQSPVRTKDQLKQLNIEYQKKFGFVFLICATGKSGDEILGSLRQRLQQSLTEELRTASHELKKINEIRLKKILSQLSQPRSGEQTMDNPTLGTQLKSGIETLQSSLNTENQQYPGLTGQISGDRQPVHSVYGGAHLWNSQVPQKMGQLALKHLRQYAPDGQALASALGAGQSDPMLSNRIYQRIEEKLAREPVEDFRIDFEDGYGNRPDEEEDRQAETAAKEVLKGLTEGSLPPFTGIRIKPFTLELYERSLRTLEIFIHTLAGSEGGKIPENFVVTLPKVTCTAQVRLLCDALENLEQTFNLPQKSIPVELMIETTQSVIGREGKVRIPSLTVAAEGRCRGVHFGTYDYTASCEIVADHQKMDNPVCDFAKHVMQVSLGGTGIWLSDGATNIMPVAPHRGEYLSEAQKLENQKTVHHAWKVAYDHCMHSLKSGFYQGWDLHPAQLIVRYAAVFRFFLEGFELSSQRLRNFVEKAAQATLVGDVFDDAATGQGLLNYFLRGLNCQALTEEEALATGLTPEEIKSKSFLKIIEKRRSA